MVRPVIVSTCLAFVASCVSSPDAPARALPPPRVASSSRMDAPPIWGLEQIAGSPMDIVCARFSTGSVWCVHYPGDDAEYWTLEAVDLPAPALVSTEVV